MPKKKTTSEFITDARKVHGNRYDYSQVRYTKSTEPVEIICSVHGVFWQKPVFHTANESGCPACAGNERITTEQFVSEAQSVHGERYDYSLANVTSNLTPVKIICREHGVFEQPPKQHRKGRGCPKCGGTAPLTQGEVIARFRKAHGDRYGYEQVKYASASGRVTLKCPDHGDFEQIAFLHWNGHGCPKCAKRKVRGEARRGEAKRG